MKKVILSVVIAAVMVPVFAQTKKEPEEIACAVMKDHKVNIAKATKSKMFTKVDDTSSVVQAALVNSRIIQTSSRMLQASLLRKLSNFWGK
jgi:hypothetical protein